MPALGDVIEVLPGERIVLPASAATAAELAALRELCEVRVDGSGLVIARRSKGLKVGAVRLGRTSVVCSPQRLSAEALLGMVVYVSGTRRLTGEPLQTALAASYGQHDLVTAALAALLIAESERVLRRHVAQGYVGRTESLQTLRGRPLFAQSALARPANRIVCHYFEKQTDVLLNQLVLAGLQQALNYLAEGALRRRAHAVSAMLLDLTSPRRRVERQLFPVARSGLTRQTEHYGRALDLSEALLFGFAAADPSLAAAAPVFDLARLFEAYISRIVQEAGRNLGLTVTLQRFGPKALVDGRGDQYRSVRPDLLISRNGRILAIADAKYKPRYLDGQAPLPARNRVSREDIYQMFFYAERVPVPDGSNVPAFVLAPQLYPGTPRTTRQYRDVHWSDGTMRASLRVVACPLEDMVRVTNAGGDAMACLQAAPELLADLSSL